MSTPSSGISISPVPTAENSLDSSSPVIAGGGLRSWLGAGRAAGGAPPGRGGDTLAPGRGTPGRGADAPVADALGFTLGVALGLTLGAGESGFAMGETEGAGLAAGRVDGVIIGAPPSGMRAPGGTESGRPGGCDGVGRIAGAGGRDAVPGIGAPSGGRDDAMGASGATGAPFGAREGCAPGLDGGFDGRVGIGRVGAPASAG